MGRLQHRQIKSQTSSARRAIGNRELARRGSQAPGGCATRYPARPPVVALAVELDRRGLGNTGGVSAPLPSWPSTPPSHGSVVLRAFTDDDVLLAVELGADPYVGLIGTLAARPTPEQALEWIRRQQGRLAEGRGLSFVVDRDSDTTVGTIGLWLRELSEGRATAGYSVAPRHRGRGVASSAMTALLTFGWTIPALHRVELYIEPWNTSSLRVAEASGFQREGLLRSHQEIGGRRRDMLLFAATRD